MVLAGAAYVDLTGKSLMPGIVDTQQDCRIRKLNPR